MTDLEWLASNQWNSMSLSRNDSHACNYVTAKQWIEEYQPEWFEDTDSAEVQRMKDTNTIWSLQIYPTTPIGSYTWYASTMERVIAMARKQANDLG